MYHSTPSTIYLSIYLAIYLAIYPSLWCHFGLNITVTLTTHSLQPSASAVWMGMKKSENNDRHI